MAEEARTVSIETFIGIDIGSAAIKIAEAQKTDNGGVAFMKVAIEQIVGLDNATDESIAGIIRDLSTENGFTARRALFVLNGSYITLRHMDFPKMAPDALEKTIRFELKKEIGYPIEECVFDYKTVREFDQKGDDGSTQKKIRIVIAAIEQRFITRFTSIAAAAGLEIAGYASSALSLYAISKRMKIMEGIGAEDVVMFIDFGNSQITASFITSTGFKFSKDINMGGSTLTTVIKTMFPGDSPLSISEAEEEKFRIGLLSQDEIDGLDDSFPRANLHKVLNVSFKKLFQRIRLSTGYYFAHFQESTLSSQTMKKICLFGGNGEIPGVTGYFSDSYDAVVAKANTWETVEKSNSSTVLCDKYNLSFFDLGAAFNEFFYPEYGITFIKEKKAPEKARPAGINDALENFIDNKFPGFQAAGKIGFLNSTLALILVYSLIFTFMFARNYLTSFRISGEKAELESKVAQLSSSDATAARKKIIEKYDMFQKKLGARKVIEFSKYGLDSVLLKISEILPEGVNLKTLSFSSEDSPVLNFSGRSAVYDRVLKLNDSLKKMKAFASVSVKRTEQVGDSIDFQFECIMPSGDGGDR